jgi:uncharacterized membrane protein YfcA
MLAQLDFLHAIAGLLVVNLLIGSIPGVVIGSLLSTRSPDRVLRPLLAVVLIISGYKLLG